MNVLAALPAGLSAAVSPDQNRLPRRQDPGREAEAVPLFAVVGEKIAFQFHGLAPRVQQLQIVVVASGIGIRQEGEVGAAELAELHGRSGSISRQQSAAQHQGEAQRRKHRQKPAVEPAAGDQPEIAANPAAAQEARQ